MTQKMVTRTINNNSQMTDPAELTGYFNLSIQGDPGWSATITVQRSFDKGSTYYDVNSWTENTQEYGLEPERGVYYRVGTKAGDYHSGIITVRLSQ